MRFTATETNTAARNINFASRAQTFCNTRMNVSTSVFMVKISRFVLNVRSIAIDRILGRRSRPSCGIPAPEWLFGIRCFLSDMFLLPKNLRRTVFLAAEINPKMFLATISQFQHVRGAQVFGRISKNESKFEVR